MQYTFRSEKTYEISNTTKRKLKSYNSYEPSFILSRVVIKSQNIKFPFKNNVLSYAKEEFTDLGYNVFPSNALIKGIPKASGDVNIKVEKKEKFPIHKNVDQIPTSIKKYDVIPLKNEPDILNLSYDKNFLISYNIDNANNQISKERIVLKKAMISNIVKKSFTGNASISFYEFLTTNIKNNFKIFYSFDTLHISDKIFKIVKYKEDVDPQDETATPVIIRIFEPGDTTDTTSTQPQVIIIDSTCELNQNGMLFYNIYGTSNSEVITFMNKNRYLFPFVKAVDQNYRRFTKNEANYTQEYIIDQKIYNNYINYNNVHYKDNSYLYVGYMNRFKEAKQTELTKGYKYIGDFDKDSKTDLQDIYRRANQLDNYNIGSAVQSYKYANEFDNRGKNLNTSYNFTGDFDKYGKSDLIKYDKPISETDEYNKSNLTNVYKYVGKNKTYDNIDLVKSYEGIKDSEYKKNI